ncbi:uncharacterized protein conserved in bacteria [Longilinea arvoryzae]|uniref:Uncharacterized protein conserved in bacteria n=1 Tax=Longilinea arvoryzae TaxID=360412 RepID=A0A0S7BNZ7_9CHLR|nr:nucleoside triphosphate pyrophosphohydrolase family protein [Longilinea arvoryzae]GAP15835.1 uncharacterized protein conserved in bacteria [Longilinea arvoryzae]
MKKEIDMVQQFHETYHAYYNQKPTASLPPEVVALRVSLIQEELNEYRTAAEAGDLVEIADALSDLMYVVLGTYLAHGLQDAAEDLFAEVQRSNMSKLDENGLPIFRADGKVLKSKLFSAPDLKTVLEKYSPRRNEKNTAEE